MQRARLIPVSGIGSEKEAEQRATSALLAVLTVVRDLSTELFAPLGASRAQKATVEAWTEVQFGHNGRKIRPHGLLRISFGKATWTALVEVKTGDATLDAEQINAYWDVARGEKFAQVITISNEISPNAGTHPTVGLRVRSNSPVQVTHLSWTAILTTAVRLKQHKGVDDPEQAFLLGELIRHLEHTASGAMAFADMGPHWVVVRDGARAHALSGKDQGVEDVVARWDQLIRYAALKLGSEIGEDVTQVFSKAHRDPKTRQAHLVEELCGPGTLDGALRIPNTAGDLELLADLRAQQLVASVTITAPQDKGAVGRISWLVNQLKEVHPSVALEAYPTNAKTGATATLGQALEDRHTLIGEDKKEAFKFRVVWRREMGMSRKSGGKNPGFIDTVLELIDTFYGEVVQQIAPWVPPAPKIKRPATLTSESAEAEPVAVAAGIDPPTAWRPSSISRS